jgi:predicted enzyme related to lactoylglutathione lyase
LPLRFADLSREELATRQALSADIATVIGRPSRIEYCDEARGRALSVARKENILANPFVHVELNTPDPKKAKAFYSKLFQWQLEDVPNPAVPDGSYTLIKVGTGTGGGLMQQIPGGPSGWLSYVGVDDIRAATKKAQSLGAEVMKDVTEVPGMGWLSFIRDPTGAVLGLWQAKSK